MFLYRPLAKRSGTLVSLLVQINEIGNIKIVLREMGLIQLTHDRNQRWRDFINTRLYLVVS